MNQKKWYKMIDWLILLGIMLVVIVFILIPFLFVFKEAFMVDGQISLANFTEIFIRQKHLLKNSLVMATITTLLTSIVSLAVALFYFITGKWTRRIIIIILSITMISPPFVTSLSYIMLFGRRGLITHDLLGLRIFPYGMWGIILMQTLGGFPLKSLVLISYLQSIDASIINSARSLGAKTSQIIKDIIIPQVRPGINIVLLLSFLGSLSDFGTPTIIGGAYEVLATEAYLAVIAKGNLPKAAAINILILLPAFIAFILYLKTFKDGVNISKGTSLYQVKMQAKGWFYRSIQFISTFFLSWVSLQYLAIILTAFTKKYRGQYSFTLEHVIKTLPYFNQVVPRTILFALLAALIGGVLGLLIGYYLKIRKIPLMKTIDFAATLPYVIPGTFFGLGYILAFKGFPFYLTGTSTIIVLNLIFKQMPFSTKVGSAAMEEISPDMLNAVTDLGGSRLDEIRDIIFPVSLNALTVSFANSFTESMTTIGSIIFLVTPSSKLLTLVLFELVSGSKYDIAAVLALLIMVICLAVNLIFLSISKWRK